MSSGFLRIPAGGGGASDLYFYPDIISQILKNVYLFCEKYVIILK